MTNQRAVRDRRPTNGARHGAGEGVANRPPNGEVWAQQDRLAFWTLVRVQMALHRLRQVDVAAAISLDRAALSRRLSGEIRERPTAWMVERLIVVLKLEDCDAERLRRLAGLAVEELDVQVSAAVPQPDDDQPAPAPSAPTAAMGHGVPLLTDQRWLFFAGTTLILLALVPVLLAVRGALKRETVVVASIPPGGVWLSPTNGDTVNGSVQFAARAYPTSPGDPAIAYVQFTVSWDGRPGPWLVACHVTRPSHDDVYTCSWDPAAAGAPAGPLRISFDVVDRATPPHVGAAPNGVHTLLFVPAAQR
jgi:hypothetical protein